MAFKRLTTNVMVLLMLTLWTMMSASAALFVCPPNACDSVQCNEVKEEDCHPPQGYIKPDGGVCGCCPKCITYLEENTLCLHELGLLGASYSNECAPGLICKDRKCQKLSLDTESHT